MKIPRFSTMRTFFGVLAMALVLATFALPLALPVDEHDGGEQGKRRIANISPSCAGVGEQVTITGHLFDEEELVITVGGVPARIVQANERTATFVVPPGVSLGSTIAAVSKRDEQDDPEEDKQKKSARNSIAFKVCDLRVPKAWGGEWEIIIRYTNATTGSLTATDDITTFIRTDEPFGLSGAVKLGTCTGSISDSHLAVQCSGQTSILTCAVSTTAQVVADLSGDIISGAGTNTQILTGQCGPFGNVNQTILISGQRLSVNQDPSGPPTTLVRSFAPFGSLIDSGQ